MDLLPVLDSEDRRTPRSTLSTLNPKAFPTITNQNAHVRVCPGDHPGDAMALIDHILLEPMNRKPGTVSRVFLWLRCLDVMCA